MFHLADLGVKHCLNNPFTVESGSGETLTHACLRWHQPWASNSS